MFMIFDNNTIVYFTIKFIYRNNKIKSKHYIFIVNYVGTESELFILIIIN